MQITSPVLKPDDLAQRWGCSAKTVKKLLIDQKLKGFRVGSAWRIRPEHVEEYELCQIGNSQDSTGNGASDGSSSTKEEKSADVIALAQKTAGKPKRLARLDTRN